MVRHCANPGCKRPITHCMGFVKAGDIIEYEDGHRRAEHVRELCGRCGFYISLIQHCPAWRTAFLRYIGYDTTPLLQPPTPA
jgi:hypothetical protein